MSGGAVGTGSDLDDEADRFWRSTAMATGIGAILWVGIMFALGAVLAVSIPRVPRLASLTGQSRSSRELWLERFYLVVLTVGLLGFYASVPLVAVEVLAVTLALFGLLLAIRIIHFGVLHRGLWAFWNVLRDPLSSDPPATCWASRPRAPSIPSSSRFSVRLRTA